MNKTGCVVALYCLMAFTAISQKSSSLFYQKSSLKHLTKDENEMFEATGKMALYW